MAGNALGFDIEMSPDYRNVHWALTRLENDLSDFRPLFGILGGLFKDAMRKQFATEGAFGAGGWKPLSPAYKLWKEEHYPGRPIGVLETHLRQAMTGGQGYSEHLTDTTASFGMDPSSKATPYGKYFAEKRRVLVLPRSEWIRWRHMADQWIMSVLGEAASAFGQGRGGWQASGGPLKTATEVRGIMAGQPL